MNNDNLYDAFGDISSKHIEEARDYRPARNPVWIKLVALAVCVFLIFVARFMIQTSADIRDVLRRPKNFRELILGGDQVMMYTGTKVMIDGVSYEYCPEAVTSAFKLRRFVGEYITTNEQGKWYTIEGEPDYKWLIRKGKNGWYSLWVYSFVNQEEVPKLPD